MMNQITITILLVIGFISIIVLSEFIYKNFTINPEFTRKIAHVLGTLSSLIFLFTLDSHWYVLFIGVVFFLILFIGRKKRFFKSIDSVKRRTAGSYLLPVSVYLCFLISDLMNNNILFIIPILILGISDPLAGLLGMNFKSITKKIKFLSYTFNKTILGSAVFFLSAFVFTFVTLYFSNYHFQKIFFISFLVAISTTITEIISIKGTDNLTVPMMAVLMLILFG